MGRENGSGCQKFYVTLCNKCSCEICFDFWCPFLLLLLASFVHVARTNGDLRGTRSKGIVATSRKPSAEVKPASASLDLDEEFLTELAESTKKRRDLRDLKVKEKEKV